MKQVNIANILNRDPADISRVLAGKRKVSWSMAEQLSRLLPAKTIDQWKRATTNELKQAFYLIEKSSGGFTHDRR